MHIEARFYKTISFDWIVHPEHSLDLTMTKGSIKIKNTSGVLLSMSKPILAYTNT